MRKKRMFVLVFVVGSLAMVGACEKGEPRSTSVAVPTTSASEADPKCIPGPPVRVKGFNIDQVCPTSEPASTGHSEKLGLGSVLAPLPCSELPDFAGSFWKVVPPYPNGLRDVGHELIPGRMTLVSKDEARFTAKAIRVYMGTVAEGSMRFPRKGDLELTFERIEGSVPAGGCA
jgi:hypothetical protein